MILAIDPGPAESAWCYFRDGRPHHWTKEPNADVLDRIGTPAEEMEAVLPEKHDPVSGENKAKIPKPTDKQLAAVGVLNAIIEQGGGEDGIRQREEQRKTYKYTDPAIAIQKRMDLVRELGLSPDEEQAETLANSGYPWNKDPK